MGYSILRTDDVIGDDVLSLEIRIWDFTIECRSSGCTAEDGSVTYGHTRALHAKKADLV